MQIKVEGIQWKETSTNTEHFSNPQTDASVECFFRLPSWFICPQREVKAMLLVMWKLQMFTST